jgi:hypothetical protein
MYIKRLIKKIPAEAKVDKTTWKGLIGKNKRYSDLVEFFERELSTRRLDDVLNEYIPELIEGLSGAAFHGLITLGYALEFMDDTSNVAEGLAYLTFCNSSLGIPSKTNQFKDPLQVLKEVRADRTFEDVVQRKFGFQTGMTEMGKHSQALQKYDLGIPSDADPEELVQTFMKVAVELFLETGALDFFLLHGVTSMRALKTILSHIKDKETQLDALRFFWRAAVCTYVVQQEKPLEPIKNFESKHVSWSDIIDRAIREDDEHLIKLIFVCHEEGKESGNKERLYKEAAQRALNHYEANKSSWDY